MIFKVKKLSDLATIPTRSDSGAAGYDLYSAEDTVIYGGCRKLIKTNIAIHCDNGWFGKIEGRSGLAYKKGLAVLGGVIDENYNGDIGVILFNTGEETAIIKQKDRIAQIIFQRYGAPELAEVEELDETVRGANGYGSSGD